jgi:protein involved in polysaccharide export with SLBB domain
MNAQTRILVSTLGLIAVSVAASAQPGTGHSRRSESTSRRAGSASQKTATVSMAPATTGVVTLMGAFGKPGDVAFAPGMTVRTAIVAAGGFGPDADPASVTLRRTGAAALAKIDGQAAMEGDLDQNAALKPGDVLVVMVTKPVAVALSPEVSRPETHAAAQTPAPSAESTPQSTGAAPLAPPPAKEAVREVVKIEGEVAHPGVYEYKAMAMQDVLKLVSLTKDAEKCKIVIFRGSPADPAHATTIFYDAEKVAKGRTDDMMLQPGDIIQVPKHRKYNLFSDVVGRLKPSKQVVEGFSGIIRQVAPLALNGIAPGAGALGLLK